MAAHFVGVFNKLFLLYDVEHGKGCRTCEVVASECSAELSVHRLEFGRNQHAAHGEAAGYAFGNGYDVGADAEVLVGKELARASVAALYLVADKDGARVVARLAQALHELRCCEPYAAHALYALYYDGAYVAFSQFRFECVEVVHGQERGVPVAVDWRVDFRVVSRFHGERRAPVKGVRGREHAGAPVLERSQLEGVFVCLCARVDKEQAVVVVARGFA